MNRSGLRKYRNQRIEDVRLSKHFSVRHHLNDGDLNDPVVRNICASRFEIENTKGIPKIEFHESFSDEFIYTLTFFASSGIFKPPKFPELIISKFLLFQDCCRRNCSN